MSRYVLLSLSFSILVICEFKYLRKKLFQFQIYILLLGKSITDTPPYVFSLIVYIRYAMALYNQHVCPVDNW